MCIKRKVNISCLDVRLGICLLLAFVPQLLFAQEDSVRFIRDSIQIQPEFNESLFSPFRVFPLETLPFFYVSFRNTPILCPIFH